jgi:acetylornithine deacetylase/succinyl-diaminopimelate desuccinylase-like protein
MKFKFLLLNFYILIFSTTIFSQLPDDIIFEKYAKASFPQLKELLSMPNDANNPDELEPNIKWSEKHFEKRGFTTSRLETETVPLLLAEKKCRNKNAKTVLIYLQVDGQPVDPNHWFQKNPYEATLKEIDPEGGWKTIAWSSLFGKRMNRDWRIFARSTSDAKGPVNMFLTAVDMMMDKNESPNFHMKVILDFEEELGSPQLPNAVTKYKKQLASDMFIIFDGPMHITNQPTLTFGARGISTITLKIFGPVFPQHSGHYGNWVPNPAVRLSQLISSMKDEGGRVTIPGYYDGITISEKVKGILKSIPDDEAYLNAKIGIASGDKVAQTYQESLQYPSLNVRGMSSGWVGSEKRTIIPSSAVAEIDVRLVLESDPDRLIKLIREHIVSQGYLVLDRKPTSQERAKHPRICQFTFKNSYLAFRTDFDSEVGQWLNKAMIKAFGESPIRIRTAGGSIPISPFVNQLGIPAVSVPTVNRDNNQHSPNENIRVGNYVDGIKTMYSILTERLD